MKGGSLETNLQVMKEKATKLNKGIRGTNSVPKTMNKGKRTAKQGRADKKSGKKKRDYKQERRKELLKYE